MSEIWAQLECARALAREHKPALDALQVHPICFALPDLAFLCSLKALERQQGLAGAGSSLLYVLPDLASMRCFWVAGARAEASAAAEAAWYMCGAGHGKCLPCIPWTWHGQLLRKGCCLTAACSALDPQARTGVSTPMLQLAMLLPPRPHSAPRVRRSRPVPGRELLPEQQRQPCRGRLSPAAQPAAH